MRTKGQTDRKQSQNIYVYLNGKEFDVSSELRERKPKKTKKRVKRSV